MGLSATPRAEGKEDKDNSTEKKKGDKKKVEEKEMCVSVCVCVESGGWRLQYDRGRQNRTEV